ncbi:hypothetical protein TD95_001806 [Thielaviopsis punctulata]|uniref:Telomere length regulation protein conserved domain-containing protein n=1 Tax=Thielaviopsis punctulata TaxID=72032 RepID=A0A0F4ZB65_9PEZI|nr:hypothetical protein TD95_001806 [Thielaviopsis punctulata]
MDELLRPISTTYSTKKTQEEPLFTLSSSKQISSSHTPKATPPHAAKSTFSSSQDVLETLKSQPEYEDVISALEFVRSENPMHDGVHSQICKTLVAEIVPNYWPLFHQGSTDVPPSRDAGLLLAALKSLAGVNALVTELRVLIQEAKAETGGPKRPDLALSFGTLIDVMSLLLQPRDFVCSLWQNVAGGEAAMKKRLLAQQFVSMLAGGQIMQVTAEAEMLSGRDKDKSTWVSSGKEYSLWIARNVAVWHQRGVKDNGKICADIMSKTLRIGYPDAVFSEIFESLLLSSEENSPLFVELLGNLPTADQKRMFDALLNHLAISRLSEIPDTETQLNPKISAAAGLIRRMSASSPCYVDFLVTWLTSATGAGLGSGLAIRRAVIGALGYDREAISQVLNMSIEQFGDKLYMSHAPILQQEVHAQVVLLAAGYVFRQSSVKIKTLLRTNPYLPMVSNRLSSSNVRGRVLGMVIAETLSGLVDGANKLSFGMEETDADDVVWMKGLPKVVDEPGPITSLIRSRTSDITIPSGPPLAGPEKKPQKKKTEKVTVSKVKPIIEEIDSESEDEDLQAYAKPDSDAEDSEEDATLVTRNKPKAPVYIRTLLQYIRDTESYDKQKLALDNAALLVRRKANFGTEVADHIDELVSALLIMDDHFDIPDFYQKRLDAIVALVVAQPQLAGPILARDAFMGDFSLAQRASILSAIAIGIREVAGIDNSKYTALFPSKRLPAAMEDLYLTESARSSVTHASAGAALKPMSLTELDMITEDFTHRFVSPIAASAVDSQTGPDALKVETLSGRVTRKTTARPRIRAIPNTTAALIARSAFFPLTAHMQRAVHVHGSVFFQHPFLMATAVKTLAVCLHAAGPATLVLPQMISELWDILLALRTLAARHLNVLGSLFAAWATVLEVMQERQRELCEQYGRRIVETQEWAAEMFGKLRGGEGAGEENRVKMLVAAVLVRLREVVERYQALLWGEWGVGSS